MSPLPCGFALCSFTRSQPQSKNINWKISKANKFRSFKLRGVLRSVIKSLILLRPSRAVNHAFARWRMLCTKPTRSSLREHLEYRICWLVCEMLVFRSLLFYLAMAPEGESGDAGHPVMPKESRKVLPFREKCYVKEKHSILRVWYYPWFLASTGGLGRYSPEVRGLL